MITPKAKASLTVAALLLLGAFAASSVRAQDAALLFADGFDNVIGQEMGLGERYTSILAAGDDLLVGHAGLLGLLAGQMHLAVGGREGLAGVVWRIKRPTAGVNILHGFAMG